jgi:hypothetical protein
MSADFQSGIDVRCILPVSRAKARGIPMPAKAGAPFRRRSLQPTGADEKQKANLRQDRNQVSAPVAKFSVNTADPVLIYLSVCHEKSCVKGRDCYEST